MAVSKKQRNGTCMSQRKSSDYQMIARYYGTFPYRIIDKENKRCQLTGPSCPFDFSIANKEEEKCINYNQLKYEITRMRRMKKVDVIPVVIGAL